MSEPRPEVPAYVRLWHALTALLFISLVISGFVLHYSSPEFTLLDYGLATDLHDISGIALAVLYILYLIYIVGTGYWREYVPLLSGLGKRLLEQIRIYIADMDQNDTIAADKEKPRFNALQQLTYLIVIFGLLPLLIVTGLIYLYYPDYTPARVLDLAGLWPVALAHYALGILGTLYLITHVYMAVSGRKASARFKLMVTGRAGSDKK